MRLLGLGDSLFGGVVLDIQKTGVTIEYKNGTKRIFSLTEVEGYFS